MRDVKVTQIHNFNCFFFFLFPIHITRFFSRREMNWEVTERLHNGSNQQYEIYTKERGLVFTTLWFFLFYFFSAKDRGIKLTDRRRTNSQKSHSHNKKNNITHTAEKKTPFTVLTCVHRRQKKKYIAQVWHKKNVLI